MIAPVLKTGDPEMGPGVRIPPPSLIPKERNVSYEKRFRLFAQTKSKAYQKKEKNFSTSLVCKT